METPDAMAHSSDTHAFSMLWIAELLGAAAVREDSTAAKSRSKQESSPIMGPIAPGVTALKLTAGWDAQSNLNWLAVRT
jgi:hypothetical protein